MFQFEHSHSDGAAWNYWLEGVVRSVLEHSLEHMHTNAQTQVQDAERGEIVAEVSASSAETPPLEELKWVRSLLYDL